MSHARNTINLPTAWQMRTPKFSLKIFIVLFFITFLGGLLRWLRLTEPKAVVFDEIYYALDAQSLLQSGVEKVAIENPDAQMLLGDTNLFFNEGAFVAHPPTGKWLIALGQYLFGFNTFGWRFSSALFGTLLIILTFLVARELLKSNWFALFAASLVALDGLAIVMSRIALLDGFLTFFVLLAVLFLLKDLETSAVRIDNSPIIKTRFGSYYYFHWYRWLAGISLGLAISVKWSGLWFLGILGLLALEFDLYFRSHYQPKFLFLGHLLKDWWLIFIQLPLTVVLVYVISWTGWFASSLSWGKNYYDSIWQDFYYYHQEIFNFHTQLTQEHNYESYAAGWPILLRPTAFYYEETNLNCPAEVCASEILALGNPAIWWVGAIALIFLLLWFIKKPRFEVGVTLVLFLTAWLPWFIYYERPTFYFYSIAMIPFIAIALALSFRQLTWILKTNGFSKWSGISFGSVYLFIVLVLTLFFLPVLTAISIPKNEWLWRIWFDTWI